MTYQYNEQYDIFIEIDLGNNAKEIDGTHAGQLCNSYVKYKCVCLCIIDFILHASFIILHIGKQLQHKHNS